MERTLKTALVLGANGHVGNAVAVAFSRAGYKTYGVIRNEKHSSTLALQEVIPVVGTLTEPEWLSKLGHVDVVVNTTQDVKNLDQWVGSLHNILKTIQQAQQRKPLFIFTSGMTMFGDTGRTNEPGFHSINEESPQKPISISTWRSAVVDKFLNIEEAHTAVVIPGMIYGKGQSLYGIYLNQAAKGDKIVAHGKPDTVWHGVHVDDVADVYVRVGNLGEKAHKQSYLVGNDKYETIGEILKAVSNQFGGKHEIVYEEPKGDAIGVFESTSIWIDNGKIKRELGWSQRKPNFTEGIEQYATSWKAYVALNGGDSGSH